MNFVVTTSQDISFLPEFGNIFIFKREIWNRIFSFQKNVLPFDKFLPKIIICYPLK
jgi:hypothetical protein